MTNVHGEGGLSGAFEKTYEPSGPRPCVGILIEDPINRRLIESLALQLELVPLLLSPKFPPDGGLYQFELVIADEPFAREYRSLLQQEEDQTERLNPAVVAVLSKEEEGVSSATGVANEQGYEGVLILPQDPGPALAQLSLILYAHRAFARRYHSAFEELHLNRRIFRSVTNGISVADATQPDLPLVYVNPAFEVMSGYSLEEVLGKNCRFLQGGETNQPGLALIRQALATKREVTAVIKNFRKDGSFFWNELTLSPIFNHDGELTHFVGIQMDVTARVEFEAALRESEKLAAVGRLAASIAHEINNPLESVMNLLYLAQHSIDTDDTKRFVDQADTELQRVALITSQSLRFYKQSTKPQAIQSGEMLHSVLDLYKAKLNSAHISVEMRERSTETIICLESEIRQVLSNLIRNAIDAMQQTGGRLCLRTREALCKRSGLRGVVMTIADTGTGISAATKKQLGKAFFTTKGLSGTGLGLWVSQEIINRHRGRLLVRSSQYPGNTWTVFQLFLPYQGLS
jgi:two-component system sporulation sensor kinase C